MKNISWIRTGLIVFGLQGEWIDFLTYNLKLPLNSFILFGFGIAVVFGGGLALAYRYHYKSNVTTALPVKHLIIIKELVWWAVLAIALWLIYATYISDFSWAYGRYYPWGWQSAIGLFLLSAGTSYLFYRNSTKPTIMTKWLKLSLVLYVTQIAYLLLAAVIFGSYRDVLYYATAISVTTFLIRRYNKVQLRNKKALQTVWLLIKWVSVAVGSFVALVLYLNIVSWFIELAPWGTIWSIVLLEVTLIMSALIIWIHNKIVQP